MGGRESRLGQDARQIWTSDEDGDWEGKWRVYCYGSEMETVSPFMYLRVSVMYSSMRDSR